MRASPRERLARRVDMIPIAGCWLWRGAVGSGGYGVMFARGRYVGAHRASWLEHNGPIPAGLQVLRQCDVRSCVNPAHLFLGTHAENMADMCAKGRSQRNERRTGEQNGRARLTWEQVRAIRDSLDTNSKLARRFGVSYWTIYCVRTGRNWKENGTAA